MKLTSKTLKAKRPEDKLFSSFIGEVYDARNRYNKAEDGLRQFDYDSGQYIDANDKGVNTLNESITE